jgi:hypothetical protein
MKHSNPKQRPETVKAATTKPSSSARAIVSPLRDGLNAMWAEVGRAAERLGFDTTKKDWMKVAMKEEREYPFLPDEDQAYVELLPRRIRARIRALELIGGYRDMLRTLESTVEDADEYFVELQGELAAGPAPMPCGTFINQLDDEVA